MSREVDSSAFLRYIPKDVVPTEVLVQEGITRRHASKRNPAWPLPFMTVSDKRRVRHLNFLVERVTLFAVEGRTNG
jgi:hypothetical protein